MGSPLVGGAIEARRPDVGCVGVLVEDDLLLCAELDEVAHLIAEVERDVATGPVSNWTPDDLDITGVADRLVRGEQREVVLERERHVVKTVAIRTSRAEAVIERMGAEERQH